MSYTPDMHWYTVTTHGLPKIIQQQFGAENLDQLMSGIKRHMVTTNVDRLIITRRGPHTRPWLNVLTGREETSTEHYVVLVPNHNDFDSKLCSCGKWWPCGV